MVQASFNHRGSTYSYLAWIGGPTVIDADLDVPARTSELAAPGALVKPAGNPNEIRQLIDARIHAAQLPHAENYEVFGRKGDGLPCACCDAPINRPQIEYDVELLSKMGAVTTLPMHVACYRAWYEVSHAILQVESDGK